MMAMHSLSSAIALWHCYLGNTVPPLIQFFHLAPHLLDPLFVVLGLHLLANEGRVFRECLAGLVPGLFVANVMPQPYLHIAQQKPSKRVQCADLRNDAVYNQ
eukprot:3116787-Ditylum_brightwellii.AAC.1